jgi:hypothetical protein
MSKRKFKQGRKIKSLDALAKILEADGWVYYWHKPLHPNWIRSMTLGTIVGSITRGALRRAIHTGE